MLARKPHAASGVNVVVTAVAATTAGVSRALNRAMSHVKIARASAKTQAVCPLMLMLLTRTPHLIATSKAIKTTSNANPANAAAVTVMAVSAANVLMALSVPKMALKPLFLLKIQYQMRRQPSRYVGKQLLNL